MLKKSGLLWGLVFTIVFLLSQDYLFIDWDNATSLFGLPKWVSWFAFVHLLFIGTLYFFAKKHWK
ncbi:MAG: hypothetical protein AAF806_12065 [Bacteroidota bacterium]